MWCQFTNFLTDKFSLRPWKCLSIEYTSVTLYPVMCSESWLKGPAIIYRWQVSANLENVRSQNMSLSAFSHYIFVKKLARNTIGPPQLYSEVIEDNFLLKTLFTEWKSNHFWPRYCHFCVISSTTTPNCCHTARRFYRREYGMENVYCILTAVP